MMCAFPALCEYVCTFQMHVIQEHRSVATAARISGRGRPDPPIASLVVPTCCYCHKPGHTKRNCPELANFGTHNVPDELPDGWDLRPDHGGDVSRLTKGHGGERDRAAWDRHFGDTDKEHQNMILQRVRGHDN